MPPRAPSMVVTACVRVTSQPIEIFNVTRPGPLPVGKWPAPGRAAATFNLPGRLGNGCHGHWHAGPGGPDGGD